MRVVVRLAGGSQPRCLLQQLPLPPGSAAFEPSSCSIKPAPGLSPPPLPGPSSQPFSRPLPPSPPPSPPPGPPSQPLYPAVLPAPPTCRRSVSVATRSRCCATAALRRPSSAAERSWPSCCAMTSLVCSSSSWGGRGVGGKRGARGECQVEGGAPMTLPETQNLTRR